MAPQMCREIAKRGLVYEKRYLQVQFLSEDAHMVRSYYMDEDGIYPQGPRRPCIRFCFFLEFSD
jgi:hypothetical protein